MRKSFLLFVALAALSATGYAATPRAQLQQMVEQLQKNPTDRKLRENIIKQALALKPSPIAPAEVAKFEGRAEYAFKNAKDANGFLEAAKEYDKALLAAPWVAVNYFNRGVAYEKAGDPKKAIESFELYLLAAPTATDARDVTKRIGGLEFSIEQANSPQAREQRRREEFLAKLRGAVWQHVRTEPIDKWSQGFIDRRLYFEMQGNDLVSVIVVENVHPESKALNPDLVEGKRTEVWRTIVEGPRFNLSARNPVDGPLEILIADDAQTISESGVADIFGGRPFKRIYQRVR